jgi:hypothetical protein
MSYAPEAKKAGKGIARRIFPAKDSRPLKAGKLGKVMRYALPIGEEGEY